MDITVVDELNTIEATTVDLTVEVPNTAPSINITQQRLNTDVTTDNNQIVVEGGLIVENVNETFDVETNSVVITLDVIDSGSTVVVKESVLDVSVEAKTEIVEVLYGPGGGGITIADMNAIYAYAGADSANTVTNNRFFTNLFGWTISGGGTRLERTDPEVPANAPSQFVCKFGGQLARYTGKVLNVVNGERVYAEVSVATLAGGAPTISLKVFRYGPTGVKLGEETLDFANATSAWTRLAGFFETPNDGTTTVEFVLEISGANNTYDNTKRWYFTNGKLYSTASEEILSASIETINTVLYDPIDGLTVQYSLALNNNGRITGIRANATGTETDFAILTDKFYVLDPSDNNNYEQVFEIVNGVVKLRELIANDITATTITVKNNGQIKVQDSQMVPVDRVEIGKIGADYGLRVRNAAGDIIFNVDSLGANTVNSTQLVSGAVTPGKTNIAAINSGSGNLNSDVVDVANIINGAVTAAKTNLAAINSGTGNLNSNTVDTAQIIASAVTAAKTNLAAINSSTGNLNSNTVDTAQIINGAISDAAKFSNSIRPVEVVGALPGSGNFDGRTVFLTTDKKIYRYDAVAGSYTASVPAGDLSGQITGTQITDGSITTPKIAANAVTANEIAANTITAAKIAANTITAGQIAAATITATQIAADSITASRLVITSFNNLIQDSDLRDPNYWTFENTWTINTSDSIVLSNMGVRAAFKSPTGNGTLSQTATSTVGKVFPVEPGGHFRVSMRGGVTAGFTGIGHATIQFFDQAFAYISGGDITCITIDYRTVANGGSPVIGNFANMAAAPATAYYARYLTAVFWSTTINNAGNFYAGLNFIQRASGGELIVDGAITAAKIAANTITAGQIAAGTITATQIAASTITGDKIAANTITASRLLITNSYNMVADADLQDPNYWVYQTNGITINSADSIVTTNLGIRAAWKSANGNGTLSQAASEAGSSLMIVEAGKPYRFYIKTAVTSGFTGVNVLYILWYKRDGSASSITPLSSFAGADYRAVASGGIVTFTIDGQVTAPSDAHYMRIQPTTLWSTVINNAGNGYLGLPQVNRANNGELIVDGTITAAKIQAGTITATQIAAGTITATQIAANSITASRLVITNTDNLIADSDLVDSSYWVFESTWVINNDALVTTNLQARAALKSPTGNGTMSQSTSATYGRPFTVERNKSYRVSARVGVTSGFTGVVQVAIQWFDKDYTYISATAITSTDYRTSAAGSITVQELDGLGAAPSNAYYGRYLAIVNWSTTLNNAGNVYSAFNWIQRAASGELIVDGTITATKIAANTITAGQIAANTITAGQIAANTITASRLLLGDTSNMVSDADLADASYWSLANGMTINSADTADLAAIPSFRAFKTATGNGTMSQAACTAYVTITNWPNMEPSKPVRYSASVRVKSGFTGRIYLVISHFDRVRAYAGSDNVYVIADYRTTAAGADTLVTGSAIGTVSATTAFVRYGIVVDWSTTQNNAQVAYIAVPKMSRAVNAELIVDGTITAAKIQAGTITATQIAANSITASRIVLTDAVNMIRDSEYFEGSALWNVPSGPITYVTSDALVTALNAIRVAKITGAGLSEPAFAYNYLEQYNITIEPTKSFHCSVDYAVTSGFNGFIYGDIAWFDNTGGIISLSTFGTPANYLTVAAGSTLTGTLSEQVTPAAGAVRALFRTLIWWGADFATRNKGGTAGFTRPYMRRAVNAELIVDGTITAAKIQAGTISGDKITANTFHSTGYNDVTKSGWILKPGGSIEGNAIAIYNGSGDKIFGIDGMSYNGSNFYGLDQIITKINKASEDGSPDTQIFDGTNPDTWVDLCDLAITATGGQDIDIDVSTDLLIEQLFDTTINIKYVLGAPEFRFRLRRTQGGTVDLKTSEWFKITSIGQIPAALFTVRDTTASAGSTTYLLQAQWRKGYYNAGTVSKSAVSETITGSGVSWLANIGASGSISEGGFPAIRASGSINFAGQPANGNTFTLNGTTVTFVTGTPVGNQVQIGGNLNTTINSAVSFLNGSADAQISKCTYFNGGGTQIIIYYDEIGTTGNSFTLAEVGANITVSAATLSGGTAYGPVPWEIKVVSVDPNWWPINTLQSRASLSFNPDTSAYNALSLASLSGAAYEVRANYHAVIMRLKNYTIRTTEYRNTAVT